MANKAAAEAAPEVIWVQLANHQRTSLGDYADPGIVELPADEARQLIQSGHAVRVFPPDPSAPSARHAVPASTVQAAFRASESGFPEQVTQ